MKQFKIYLSLLTFLMVSFIGYAQECSVNAGSGNKVCGTEYDLGGDADNDDEGTYEWTLTKWPNGAEKPTFNAKTKMPKVSGLVTAGSYTFTVVKKCNKGGTATSSVTISVSGTVKDFTAGDDITDVKAVDGVVQLKGVVPNGYKAEWTYYHLLSKNTSKRDISAKNATLSGADTAAPTLTLTNKANHSEDPTYVAVLKITSLSDSSCTYTDETIVSFIPNPKVVFKDVSRCIAKGSSSNPIDFVEGESPFFSTEYKEYGGSVENHTTVTLEVISVPSGQNPKTVTFKSFSSTGAYINGISTIGEYKFKIKVKNRSGEHTTQEITYKVTGYTPELAKFDLANHKNQLVAYASGGSGGEVFCTDMIGKKTPITFHCTVNDGSVTTKATADNSFFKAAGTAVGSITMTGDGSLKRSFTVQAPTRGWQAGTYPIYFSVSYSGECGISQMYYIHISDGKRENVKVKNQEICFVDGGGSTGVVIELPAVYQNKVHPSYLNSFLGEYFIETIDKPKGAAEPKFEATPKRYLTAKSTEITNLNKAGKYKFKIYPRPYVSGIGKFLEAEYACSNAEMVGEFSIDVISMQGSNAGSDRIVSCRTSVKLNGNVPKKDKNATGLWTILSKPAGSNPTFEDTSLYNTKITIDKDLEGDYVLQWTVTTGKCPDVDEVTITVSDCKPMLIISNPMMRSRGNYELD